MKKKYQKKVKLVNSNEVFQNNVKLYCNIVAKKTGKDTKLVEKYFNDYFMFLDELGVLNYIPQKRINRNIKTLVINYVKELGRGMYAYYTAYDNVISLKQDKQVIFENADIIHEFNHMLSTDTEVRKNHNRSYYNEKIGFIGRKIAFKNNDIVSSCDKFTLDELCDYIESYGIVDDYTYSEAVSWGQKFLSQKIYTIIYDNLTKKYDSEKVKEELKEMFLDKNFKSITIAIASDTIIEITKTNKTFTVYTHINRSIYDNKIDDIGYQGINEGTTELLAIMFASKYYKKDLLNVAYPTEVKCAEMMYKIFGKTLFEGYFTNTFAPMIEYSALDKEWFNELAENIEIVHKNRDLQTISSNISMVSISEALIDQLSIKTVESIIDNQEKIESAEQIYSILFASICDFAKSLYFGYDKNQIEFDSKNFIKRELANNFNICIEDLKEYVNYEDTDATKEFKEIVKNLIPLTEDKIENVVSIIEKINGNLYNFTDKNLEEMIPNKFVDGPKIDYRNDHKQDYIRTNKNSINRYFKYKDFNNYKAPIKDF